MAYQVPVIFLVHSMGGLIVKEVSNPPYHFGDH